MKKLVVILVLVCFLVAMVGVIGCSGDKDTKVSPKTTKSAPVTKKSSASKATGMKKKAKSAAGLKKK